MHTVSVTIVTYNSQQYITACLRCLSKQTYKNFSVVVIDNASSDNTVKLCRDLSVKVIQNKINVGYAAAHNQGIYLTRSKYILTLNSDVFLQPEFLYKMVEALDAAPNVGSAAGLLYRINHIHEEPFSIDGAGLFMKKNRRQGLRYEGARIQSLRRQYIFGPDGAAAFYRRAMLQDIAIGNEVFDEDFFMHKEDVDVAWRAQLAGWKSLFIPEATALHIRTFRSGHREHISSTLRYISLRNRYLLLMKNDNLWYWLRDVGYILLYDMGIFFYVLLFERTSLPAYAEACALWGKMKKKRMIIQQIKNNRHAVYQYFS